MLKFSTQAKLTIARILNQTVLAARKILGKPEIGVFRRNGLRYNLDLNEGIDFGVYLFGIYERDLTNCLEKLLGPGDLVIDAGANVGIHSVKMGDLVKEGGKVLAFEPTCYAFEKLKINLELNPSLSEAVEPHHAFLVAEPGVTAPSEIYSSWPLDETPGGHPQHGGSLKSTGEAISIHLDTFLDDDSRNRLKLIKLDVDGHELSVLQGARETIAQAKPYVVVELCEGVAEEHGHTVQDILEFFTELNYRFETLGGVSLGHDIERIVSLIPEGGGINVLAISDKSHQG